MSRLICPECSRTQNQGKYCLDCGTKLNEVPKRDVSFKPIKSSKTSDGIKKHVRQWLERIGVNQPDIKISSLGERAKIEYIYKEILYSFESYQQDSLKNNLAAIEQFLHYRVLGIERGIETVEKAFAGYAALPDYSNDAYGILGAKKGDSMHVITAKYKKLSKQLHPDLNKSPQAKESFQKIQEAYDEIEADLAKEHY